jgi:CDP-paratose 2-epimerase
MKILITGGAGFVGSNLAIHLAGAVPGCAVAAMDNLYRRGSELNLPRLHRHGVAFHWGDVRSSTGFPRGPFDLLIECSAEPAVSAQQDGRLEYLFDANLKGAFNCLEKAREWSAGFLFLSTSRVYPIARLEAQPWREEATRFSWTAGPTAGISERGVREELDMSGARSVYGYTKYAAELLIEEYRALWNLKAVVNRCGVLAGPWQFGKTDQGVLSLWALAHHFNRNLRYIGYGGTGKQLRDFLHVEDLCDLVAAQIREFDQWDGWVGNVAGGVEVSASLCELTALCAERNGRTIRIDATQATRTSDLRIFIGDCSRLFARTAWRPRRSVEDIVTDVFGWIRANEELLKTLESA